MKQLGMLFTLGFIVQVTNSQFEIYYIPTVQLKDKIQYFKPVEQDLFVGDCIPFSHNGILYLYWLIDTKTGQFGSSSNLVKF